MDRYLDIERRLDKAETHLAQLSGKYIRLRQEHDQKFACVAEFQGKYGDSIKAAAEDRAFVRETKDRLVRRMADAIAWGCVLIPLVCAAAGAWYFLRPWLRYLFVSYA